MQRAAPYYILICGLYPSALFFTLFQVQQCFRKKWKQNVLLDFVTVCSNYVLLYKEMMRCFDKWDYAFYKIPDMIFRFQINLFFLHKFLRNIQILNLMSIHQVKPKLLQLERSSWRISYSKLIILPTSLKLWWSFLLSFHRLSMKLLTFTFT